MTLALRCQRPSLLLKVSAAGRLSGPINDMQWLKQRHFFSVHFLSFQDLSEKLTEQELQFRRLSQEQVDNFTLDINTAYARLRGIEQAVQSKCTGLRDGFSQPHLLGWFLITRIMVYTSLTLGNEEAQVTLIELYSSLGKLAPDLISLEHSCEKKWKRI